MGKIGNLILMAGMALLIMPGAQAQDNNLCTILTDSTLQSTCNEQVTELHNISSSKATDFFKNNRMGSEGWPGGADTTTPVTDKTQLLKYIFPPPPSKIPGVKRHDWPTPTQPAPTKPAPKTKAQPNSDNQQPNIFQ